MSAFRRHAFFMPMAVGQRLALHHVPPSGVPLRAAVVYVHPFAEEMNKSRRMAAEQSRRFAANGIAVLQIDLLGCGDSSGDDADGTWAAWIEDIVAAASWLRAQHPGTPLWLWGLRSGCLLASAALQRLDGPLNLLLWQPLVSGKPLLQLFLRLKTMTGVAGDAEPAVLPDARARLNAGEALEIAGYRLMPGLAADLESAVLAPPRPGSRAVWLEVVPREGSALQAGSLAVIERWRQGSADVDAGVVAGPPFWQTAQIEIAPGLWEASLRALGGAAKS